MKSFLLSILYFTVSVLFIIVKYDHPFLPPLLLKSLIIPILLVIFLINLNPSGNRFHIMILLGLAFSWAGDVLLQFTDQGTDMFIPGLLCFLLAHVMYLSVFFGSQGNNGFLEKHFYAFFVILLYGVALTGLLWEGLGKFKIPVIVYSLVILSMLAGAINRYYKTERRSYYMVLAGAILFVLSDSLLAINKFSYPFAASGFAVMSTYVLAQFLIITGYLAQERKTLV